LAPHAWSFVPRWQEPSAAQQPRGQLVPSQTHVPLTQRWPEAQTLAQEPQWSLSVCRLAQPSGQKTAFGGQAVQVWLRHCPLQHWASPSQAIPSLLQAQRGLPSDPAAP
jgi:hypothetical protein